MVNNLPESVRGVIPLLFFLRVFGFTPYNIVSPCRIVRSASSLVLASLAIFAQSVMALFWPVINNVFDPTRCHIGVQSLNAMLYGANIAVGLAFPVYVLIAATTVNITRFQKLLCYLTELEGKFRFRRPRCTNRAYVLTCMTACSILSCVHCAGSGVIWKLGPIFAVYGVWLSSVVSSMAHLFCILASQMRYYFNLVNDEIVTLTKILIQMKNVKSTSTSIFSTKLIPWVLVEERSPLAKENYLSEKISRLRESYELIQKTCFLVESIFRVINLFFYALVLAQIVTSLYFIALSVEAGHHLMDMVHLFSGAALALGMGTAVAVTAEATAAVGEETSQVATALAVAAKRDRAAFKEIKLLLLRIQTGPVRFTVGGLFKVDLRFFVGLLGTTLGYLVVVVQFSQTALSSDPHMDNCSRSKGQL